MGIIYHREHFKKTRVFKAAVAGEKCATEKVLAHYADYIDELSTVEIRQPGGKVKKVIDEKR